MFTRNLILEMFKCEKQKSKTPCLGMDGNSTARALTENLGR